MEIEKHTAVSELAGRRAMWKIITGVNRHAKACGYPTCTTNELYRELEERYTRGSGSTVRGRANALKTVQTHPRHTKRPLRSNSQPRFVRISSAQPSPAQETATSLSQIRRAWLWRVSVLYPYLLLLRPIPLLYTAGSQQNATPGSNQAPPRSSKTRNTRSTPHTRQKSR